MMESGMPILQDDTTFTSATLGEFHLSILRGEGIIDHRAD
jgi:hypothetical protein